MPILGAFVWGLIIGIGRVLLWLALRWGPTVVGNLLIYFGLRFVTVHYAAAPFSNWFASAFGGLASEVAQVLGYVRFDVACTMIVSAYLWRVANMATAKLSMAPASSS